MALSADEQVCFERVKRAARTLRQMPHDVRSRPAGLRSVWPEMKRELHIISSTTRRAAPLRATPAAIDDMDSVLTILAMMRPAARRLLWARANGVRWAALGAVSGRSRTSLNRDFQMAVAAFCHWSSHAKKRA